MKELDESYREHSRISIDSDVRLVCPTRRRGRNVYVGTANEEGSSATLSGVASGDVHYVVIVVDTHGLDSSTDDLSGTLTVSA